MTKRVLAACVLLASLAGCAGSGSSATSDGPTLTSWSVRGPMLLSGSADVGEPMSHGPARPLPADSRRPASGMCEPSTGAIATVRLDPDIPDPRCIIVSSSERLRVVNTSAGLGQHGTSLTITFAYFSPRVLRVGAATTFHRPVGQYLAQGVHTIEVSLYGGGGPEIWLK
jgi:hypothetical protein